LIDWLIDWYKYNCVLRVGSNSQILRPVTMSHTKILSK
jgi:hypothetical protein